MCRIYEEVPSMSDEDFLKYFSSLTLKAREKVTKVLDEAREIVPEDPIKSPENRRQHPKQVAQMMSDKEYILYRG